MSQPYQVSEAQYKDTKTHTHIKERNLSFIKPGGLRIEEIRREQSKLNDTFPVHVFPGFFGEYIIEMKKSLNFPTDYTGTAIIAAVSTAIGKSSALQVKGSWMEYASFFIGIIGGPGAAKSHVIGSAFESFNGIDYDNSNRFETAYNQYNDYQSKTKKEKELLEEPTKPALIKTILHNATPEVLFQRIADNDRGCAFVLDELAYLLDNMNNYSKGDNTSALLTTWSNKQTSVDRMSKPVPLSIREPFLNIIGALQPRIIPKLFPANKTNNGFFQRFLWAYPSFTQKLPINDIEADHNVIKEYNNFIINYISCNPTQKNLENGKNEPRIYKWSREAKDFFYAWSAKNADMVNENSESLKGEVISKFDIHFVRLALVLQIMDEGQKSQEGQKRPRTFEISINSVRSASELCDYYLQSSFKVLELLSQGSVEHTLPENKMKLYSSFPETVTTSEANIIGDSLGFNIKAVQRFLGDTTLFSKVSQGNYKKISKS